MSIAQFIDHTVLKPDTTLSDIENLCNEALEWQFAAVCVPPYFVRDSRQIIGNASVKVATVIGFPFGYSHYLSKKKEAETAISDGAQELDLVMNIAAFKSNDLAWLEAEIQEILRLKEEGIAIKVIIETGLLSSEEIVKCCQLYAHFPIDFLKTSTGYAPTGASVAAVQLMRQNLPSHIHIKASGGIRNFGFARQLLDAGATSLGTPSQSKAAFNWFEYTGMDEMYE